MLKNETPVLTKKPDTPFLKPQEGRVITWGKRQPGKASFFTLLCPFTNDLCEDLIQTEQWGELVLYKLNITGIK